MERYLDMTQVSDGRLYTANDLVKADCGGCMGCSECCRGMGTSIILDPWDIFHLCRGEACSLGEACSFLNGEGRCEIHGFRPGFCRLFPLGRIYEGGIFRYFLQVQECPKENKGKVKVKKWLDMPDIRKYEQFVNDWHSYLKQREQWVGKDPEQIKPLSMELLRRFYLAPYDLGRDFYEQFYERAEAES